MGHFENYSQMLSGFRRWCNRRIGDVVLGTPFSHTASLIPGLLVAALLAWISVLVANFIGRDLMGFEKSPVSSVMVAVLLGMFVGNSPLKLEFCKPGFSFAVKKLLRLGIMLLGLRLSITEAARFGSAGIPVILICILGALAFTGFTAKALNLSPRLGTLIAVGTSICGVSAIAAAGPAIGAKEEEMSYAVAVITVFGILATLLYPFIAYWVFQGASDQVGLFIGTAVHDTSQVTGAAIVYEQVYNSSGVLNMATVTKLVRNLFMVIIIPAVSMTYARKYGTTAEEGNDNGNVNKRPGIVSMLPFFILGFLFFSIFRSIGDAGLGGSSGLAFGFWTNVKWHSVYSGLSGFGQNAIVVALAGVGLTTRLRALRRIGIKPFAAGLGAALMVGVLSAAVIFLTAG